MLEEARNLVARRMLDLAAMQSREVFVAGELALNVPSGRSEDEGEDEETDRSVAEGRELIALGADIVDVSAAGGCCFALSEAAFGRLERLALAVISQLASMCVSRFLHLQALLPTLPWKRALP